MTTVYSRSPLLVVLGMLTFIATEAIQVGSQQTTAPLPPSLADIAAQVARSGFTGGFVVPLSAPLQTDFASNLDRSIVDHQSAFNFWFRRETSPADRPVPLASNAELDNALKAYVSDAGRALRLNSTSTHWTLEDPAAALCLARLQRVVPKPVEGTHLLRVVGEAASSATGGPRPRGFVGSCLGTNQFVKERVFLRGGAPLASVLNETVKTFGSSVWVAVQANGNLCSLGLVQRAEGGGVCSGTVTELAAALPGK